MPVKAPPSALHSKISPLTGVSASWTVAVATTSSPTSPKLDGAFARVLWTTSEVMTGGGFGPGTTYVYPLASVALCVPTVTTTSAAPAALGPVTARRLVELSAVTPVAATPPMVTVAPLAKLVPVSVTVVPPAVEPEDGEMPLMVGGGSAT